MTATTTTTTKTEDHARSNAAAWYESIVEMLDTLNSATDDDAYQEQAEALAMGAGYSVRCIGEIGPEFDEDGEPIEPGFYWVSPKGERDTTMHEDTDDAWLACCDDNGLRPSEDDAQRAIEESPLSVQVRGGWYSPGDDKPDAEEFEILLSTGGPALRIRGELDRGEPDRAWLEYQDWGTPWTQYFDVEADTLLAFVRCFYFGE